ncbi:hypothetical protein PT078_07605 [Erysipelothrix rhusiopathiae]|nr:hypothetical protein [Erysipelothrix rhusiopathiae]
MKKNKIRITVSLLGVIVSLFFFAIVSANYPILDLKGWFAEFVELFRYLIIPMVILIIVYTFKDSILKLIDDVGRVDTPYGSIHLTREISYKTNEISQRKFDAITSDLHGIEYDQLDFEFTNTNQLNQFLIGETVVSYETMLQQLSSLFIDNNKILNKMKGSKYFKEEYFENQVELSYSFIYEVIRAQFRDEFDDFCKSRDIKKSVSEEELEVAINFYPGQYRRFCENIYFRIKEKATLIE